MNYHVPAANVAAIWITFVIVLALPVAILLYLKLKKGAKVSCFFIGGLTFTVFALLLERIWHFFIGSLAGSALTDNLLLYAIYGGISAGLFEETGRFVAMKFWMKKKNWLDGNNALMYGAGHGGFEVWLLIGTTYLSNLIMIGMINSGALEGILAPLDETAAAATLATVEQICTLPATTFYIAILERVGAVSLHIVLSYMVYLAISNRKAVWFVLAIILHAIVDAGIVLLANYIPLFILELLIIAIVAVVAFLLYKKTGREQG